MATGIEQVSNSYYITVALYANIAVMDASWLFLKMITSR